MIRRVVNQLLMLAPLGALLTGCVRQPEIRSTYGHISGHSAEISVNGLSVWAEMFRLSGHRVGTWRQLSPRLQRADVIVWAPDGFGLPTDEQRRHIENWLAQRQGRRFIFIGRDFDAEPKYWESTLENSSPEHAIEIQRRLGQAQSRHNRRLAQSAERVNARWFVHRRAGHLRPVRQLESPVGWIDNLDGPKADVWFSSRHIDTEEDRLNRNGGTYSTETLLLGDGKPLITQIRNPRRWGENSHLVLVNNGSFLLNLQLINHQHRRLAQRLIDDCVPASQVYFLEATYPPVRDADPDPAPRSGMEAFAVWPLGAILLHLLAVGVLVCLCLYPVFGRPRQRFQTEQLSPLASLAWSSSRWIRDAEAIVRQNRRADEQSTGDFGQHVDAIADLLRRAEAREFSEARVEQFQKLQRKEGLGQTEAPSQQAIPSQSDEDTQDS